MKNNYQKEQRMVDKLIIKLGLSLLLNGWQVEVKNNNRGWCHYHTKYISIPLWSTKRKDGFLEYYICHETAHAVAGHKHAHDGCFMVVLKTICPPRLIHFELAYKPRNAASAGITHKEK